MSQMLKEPAQAAADYAPNAQIIDLLKRGDLLDAIILYRSMHGGDLAGAKQAVEAIAADHNIAVAAGNPATGRLVVAAGFIFLTLLAGVMGLAVAMVLLT